MSNEGHPESMENSTSVSQVVQQQDQLNANVVNSDLTNSTSLPPNIPPLISSFPTSPLALQPPIQTSPQNFSSTLVTSPELQAMALQRTVFELTATNKGLKTDIQQNKKQISQLLEAQTRLEIDNKQLRDQLAHSTGEIFRLTRALDFKSAELHERGDKTSPSHDSKQNTPFSSPSPSSSSYSISHPLIGSCSLQLEFFAIRVMLSFLDFKIISSGKLDTISGNGAVSPSILLAIYFLISSVLGFFILIVNQIFIDLGLAFLGYAIAFNGLLFAITCSLINRHKKAPQLLGITILIVFVLAWFGLVNMWTAVGSILYGGIAGGVIVSKERSIITSSGDDLSKIV